jgi:acetyltransferase-like isoleucine patch superfamily enzyme
MPTIGDGTYGQENLSVYLEQYSKHKCSVGKYCSLGPKIWALLHGAHAMKSVTTYPLHIIPEINQLMQASGIGEESNRDQKGDIIIGNDVWIGMETTILGGVTIGSGAIIGACSVITKDVPPYAIVAGNPARIVKYRYNPEQIEALLRIRWWDWSREKIIENWEVLFKVDGIDEFIKQFDIQE